MSKKPLIKWTDYSEKYLNSKTEKCQTETTMKEEKKECQKNKPKDGILIILCLLTEEPKKNNNIWIISKLISKITQKTKLWKKNWMSKLFQKDPNIILKNMISKKDIPEIPKMIKVHQLKNYLSNLDIDKPMTNLKLTFKDKAEWLRDKLKDSMIVMQLG